MEGIDQEGGSIGLPKFTHPLTDSGWDGGRSEDTGRSFRRSHPKTVESWRGEAWLVSETGSVHPMGFEMVRVDLPEVISYNSE